MEEPGVEPGSESLSIETSTSVVLCSLLGPVSWSGTTLLARIPVNFARNGLDTPSG